MALDDPTPVLRPRCDCGKAIYGSQAAALRAITNLKRAKRDQPHLGRLHPYRCPTSKAVHIGHTGYDA